VVYSLEEWDRGFVFHSVKDICRVSVLVLPCVGKGRCDRPFLVQGVKSIVSEVYFKMKQA
jgi:hypothetical protein